jgi:hypothetical protein
VHSWYSIMKLCPWRITLGYNTGRYNKIVLSATVLFVSLVFDIRLPHTITTKFPPTKMKLFIQIRSLRGWKPSKNTSGKLSGKKVLKQ